MKLPPLRLAPQPVREFPFVHVEAADGSSRDLGPLVQPPAADILPGAVLATLAADGALVPLDPAGKGGAEVASCINLSRVHATPRGSVEPRLFPLGLLTLARNAEVIGSRLAWPAGFTPDQVAVAVAQLAAVGLAVL